MAKIVGVKFKNTSKIYYFAPTEEEYAENSGVVVETAKGLEYGVVAFGVKEVDDKDCVLPLKPIIRKANKRDMENMKRNEARVPEALKIAEEKVRERKLKMKLVGCEYSFDGKKVVFYFTADGRVDFRELVKDLASVFRIRIELRQVGIRDETKLIGGLAPCGRPCCCGSCMPDFRKVSIKMAKTQGLSLNPSKISGLCGRLMCCLEYESEYYGDAYKKMPKLGGKVTTPEGEGVVVSNNMLKLISKVKIVKNDGSEVYKDFPVGELKFKRQGGAAEPDEKEIGELKEILD
ncbi:MAG: stage 0 sporulation family protein [Eubacteriales bacterium]